MLLWVSAISNSEYAMVYVAICLITMGRAGGSKVLQDFFDYQLEEKVRAIKERKPQHENTDNERKENDNTDDIEKQGCIVAVILWQFLYGALGMPQQLFFLWVLLTRGSTSDSGHFSWEGLICSSTLAMRGIAMKVCLLKAI